MNLERLEELCLNYLRQSENPLVPVAKLLQHCRREEEFSGLQEEQLVEFLKPHSEVMMVEGPVGGDLADDALLSEAGVDPGPRIILRERMPTRDQLSAMIEQQLDQMVTALGSAREAALERDDQELVPQIDATLGRVEELRTRMREHL